MTSSTRQLKLGALAMAMTLAAAGAHYVVDGIWELPPVLDDINRRLAGGEKP